MRRGDAEHGGVDTVFMLVLFALVWTAEAATGCQEQIDKNQDHAGQAAHQSGVRSVEGLAISVEREVVDFDHHIERFVEVFTHGEASVHTGVLRSYWFYLKVAVIDKLVICITLVTVKRHQHVSR